MVYFVLMNISNKTYIVSPGYESYSHESGLHADTRLRLYVSALALKHKKTERIIVGGGRLRKMKESFAELMKAELVNKQGIPEEIIETEEYTFDTASQVDWIKQHIQELGENVAFITDPHQAKHVRLLFDAQGLKNIAIVPVNEILKQLEPQNFHFYTDIYHSFFGCWWIFRESLVTFFTKFFDPKGERLQRITKGRKS
jgi:hypothetical protein